MAAIGFYIILPFVLLLSVLPLPVLYFLSDLLYPVNYYIIRYRKKTVLENLRNSFPGLDEKQIRSIAGKFYRHFNDILVETLKFLTIPPGKLKKRIRFTNPEVLNGYHKRGRSVIVVTGHFNNWEWCIGACHATPLHPVVIYKPLHNPYVDRLMKKVRKRHGGEYIPMKDTLRKMLSDIRDNRLTFNAFVSDQSTIWEETQYWTGFMNQLTPVHLGPEKMSLKTGHPVVFYHIRKVKRGYYDVDIIPLVDDVGKMKEHEITEKHVRLLESIISETPHQWLWTHRRWKLTARKLAESGTAG